MLLVSYTPFIQIYFQGGNYKLQGGNRTVKFNFNFSFVMGEKTASLRGKRLSDLIHGASINKPVRTNFFELTQCHAKKARMKHACVFSLHT